MARKNPKLKAPRYRLITHLRGQELRFVDKIHAELQPEIERLDQQIGFCRRLTQICRRRWHPLIEAVHTHLILLRPNPAATDLPREICRLNAGMEDALVIINRLKFCKLPEVERLRFALTFSQTHRKKDRPGFKEDRDVIYANDHKEPHDQQDQDSGGR